MVGDGDPRRGLVGHLGQVRALDAVLGVVQGVQVAARQRRDRLRADHHPGVLDDLEHLRDAVVDLAQQGADRGDAVDLAEGQLTRGGDLQAHLVLDVGGEDAVALAELAGVRVEVELRHEEQRKAFGANARALRPGQDEVHDVVHQVVLARGDEPLDAGDVPGAVGLLDGLGPTGADVRAGVGLGQHHGAAPVLVDHDLREPQLLGRAVAEDGVGEGVAAGVHVHGRVGAEDELLDGPAQRRRYDRAAELLRQVHPPPFGVDVGLVAALERLGHPHRVGRRVVDRRVAVAVDERRGQLVLGQPGHLAEHLACDVLVHLGVRRGAQHVRPAEDLEQGELDVSQVAPVMAHGPVPLALRRGRSTALLVSNMMLLVSNKRNRVTEFGPTG